MERNGPAQKGEGATSPEKAGRKFAMAYLLTPFWLRPINIDSLPKPVPGTVSTPERYLFYSPPPTPTSAMDERSMLRPSSNPSTFRNYYHQIPDGRIVRFRPTRNTTQPFRIIPDDEPLHNLISNPPGQRTYA